MIGKHVNNIQKHKIKLTSGEIGATATGVHPASPLPFTSSGAPFRMTRDAKARSAVDVKTLVLSIFTASWPSTSPEVAISSGACGESGFMRRRGVRRINNASHHEHHTGT